ncbi:MAG: NAD-dependent epimerase/dehydratase family protein [Bryobacterales bacterium]|nr:NAD-dependent epimerase/dehydratase family protein [Bryobacterales bacterium]
MHKDTVCITGASGGIGQRLLQRLAGRFEVKALFRSRSTVSDRCEQSGGTAVWGQLGDDEALSRLVTGASYVFHCAALVTSAPYAKAYAVNVEGTRRLAKAALAHGCKRFVHVSSVAVYSGTAKGGDLAEDTPLVVSDAMPVYASTKLQAEHALRDVAGQTGLEFTILRPTSVYGPNTVSYTGVPLHLISEGLPVVLGTGDGLLDVVHVDDVVEALVLAAECPLAAGEVFNIGHESVTHKAFYSWYGEMLNRPVRRLPMPLLNAMARALGLMATLGIKRAHELHKGIGFLKEIAAARKSYPFEKARRLLGYSPRVTLPVGMLETALWASERGLIPKAPAALDWYGPLLFQPLAIAHPSTEDELAAMVGVAAGRKVPVRAIGSLHSQSPAADTEGVCLVLDKLNRLLDVEGDMVTVQAGMTVRAIHDALAARGLALPVNGSITAQTISGAISTGTHGGSVHYGSLSDFVEAVRLVRADGTVVEVRRPDELFPAVIISVGLLGIMSTVTLRCVPAFRLTSRCSAQSAPEAFKGFYALNESNRYTDLLYFPILDSVEILAVNEADPGAPDSAVTVTSIPMRANRRGFEPLRKAIVGILARLLRSSHRVQAYFTRSSMGSTYRPRTGRSDHVLAFSEPSSSPRMPGIIGDMEVGIRYEDAAKALTLLRDHFQRTRRYPLFAVHVRCSAESHQWLSPAYGRKVCWLEFCSYPRDDPFFTEMHELLKPFHYRFHWGKATVAGRHYIGRQYERWDDFCKLREQWDPEGIFLNTYLAGFFTGQPKSARPE